MRFTLLDEEDLKSLENTIAKAMVRALVSAVKIAVRDNLLPFLAPAVSASAPTTINADLEKRLKLLEDALQPLLPEVKTPTVGIAPEIVVTLKKEPVTTRPETNEEAPKEERKRRSVLQVCKTVGDRPHGYVKADEALKIMGGITNRPTLSTWILDREVDAVIVANVKPPTKGLPGRLMVDAESLRKRVELRDQNKTVPARFRKSAEKHVNTSM